MIICQSYITIDNIPSILGMAAMVARLGLFLLLTRLKSVSSLATPIWMHRKDYNNSLLTNSTAYAMLVILSLGKRWQEVMLNQKWHGT